MRRVLGPVTRVARNVPWSPRRAASCCVGNWLSVMDNARASSPHVGDTCSDANASMTPNMSATYRNVRPLQTAFVSSGLVSKRRRDLLPELRSSDNLRAEAATSQGMESTRSVPSIASLSADASQSARPLREVVEAAMADRSFNVSRRPPAAVMPDTPVKPMMGMSEAVRSARMHRRGCSMGGAFPSKSPLFQTATTPKSPSGPFSGFSSTFASKKAMPSTVLRRSGHIRSASERIPGTRHMFLNEIPVRPPNVDPDDVFEAPSESPLRPVAAQREAPDMLLPERRREPLSPRPSGRPSGVLPVCPISVPNERTSELPVPASPLDHDVTYGGRSSSMDSPNNMFAHPPSQQLTPRDDESSDPDWLEAPGSSSMSSLGWVESTPTIMRKSVTRMNEPGISSPHFKLDFSPDAPFDGPKWYEATHSPMVLQKGKSAVRPRHSQPAHMLTPPNPHDQTAAVTQSAPAGRFRSSLSSQFEDHFVVEGVLGTGEFSEVVKVREKATGLLSAVKRMKRPFHGPKDRVRRLEEVDVMRVLKEQHAAWQDPWFGAEGVVELLDAWEEEGHLYLQTELCSLGSLAFVLAEYGRQVGALDEARLWKILAELSAAVYFIHQCGVLHLDLKPANILITEVGTLKITDFGMATRWPRCTAQEILAGSHLTTHGSTRGSDLSDTSFSPAHMTPEQASLPTAAVHATVQRPRRRPARLQRRPSPILALEREGDREYIAPEVIFESKYGKPADIFSLGLILLEAACSVEIPDNGAPWHKLRCNDFSDVSFDAISATLQSVITSMLSAEPSMRPTASDLVDMPVLERVRQLMRRGLSADELDQLPLHGGKPAPAAPYPVPPVKYYEAPHTGMLDAHRTVVKIRGALIQEDEQAFLAEVLQSADTRDTSSPDTSTSLMTEDSLQQDASCTRVAPVVHTYTPALMSPSAYLHDQVSSGMDIDKTFPVG